MKTTYYNQLIIMKKPKMKSISIVASIVFAIALILNIQANLSGGLGMFGKQLFAQTNGEGSGSGSGSNCSPHQKDGWVLTAVPCTYRTCKIGWPPSCVTKPATRWQCVQAEGKCCDPSEQKSCTPDDCGDCSSV